MRLYDSSQFGRTFKGYVFISVLTHILQRINSAFFFYKLGLVSVFTVFRMNFESLAYASNMLLP